LANYSEIAHYIIHRDQGLQHYLLRRVDLRARLPPLAFSLSAGAAGWREDGLCGLAPLVNNSRVGSSCGLPRLCVWLYAETWSGSPELGRIRWLLVVFLFSAVLWWAGPEAEKVVTAGISINKAAFCCYLPMWSGYAGKLLPAGCGSEGKKWTSVSCCASPRWRSLFLLHLGANHVVAMAAATISGRKGDPFRRQASASSTSMVEAPSKVSRWSAVPSRRQVVRPRRCQGGRRWRLSAGGEDQGLDCFYSFRSRVLCAYVQDSAVISLFFQGLACILYPPTF
jgi:hypothetical protein